jgi:hypothetical protein
MVVRTGASSRTMTYRDPKHHIVYGCDGTRGETEQLHRWCGTSVGYLSRGRLPDPRLDLTCTNEQGAPMGFAWVEPDPHTRYVAIGQPGYAEVYERVGDLPIRVATISGLHTSPLGATFHVTEHDAKGTLLLRYRIDAFPAG